MDLRNYDDTSVVGTTSNTLSRAAVYTALHSFDSNTNHQVVKASSSSSLLSFYSNLSTTFHRTAPRLDGKNTSARPLASNDISARLSQRAITFTSNYYNNGSNIENTSNKKKKKSKKRSLDQIVTNTTSSCNVSTTQLKRKRQNLIQRINPINHNSVDPEIMHQCNLQFLVNLNREWNIYIKDLLLLDSIEKSDVSVTLKHNEALLNEKANININKKLLESVHRRITTLQNNHHIEWVGAYIRIRRDKVQVQQYNAKRKKTNSKANSTTESETIQGILISHSHNSWVIVPIITAEAIEVISDMNNHDVNIAVDKDSPKACDEITKKDDDHAQNQENERKKKNTTTIRLQKKVKVPKQHVVTGSTIICVVTACIPLGDNCALSTDSLINDDTRFLNIHLQRS